MSAKKALLNCCHLDLDLSEIFASRTLPDAIRMLEQAEYDFRKNCKHKLVEVLIEYTPSYDAPPWPEEFKLVGFREETDFELAERLEFERKAEEKELQKQLRKAERARQKAEATLADELAVYERLKAKFEKT